MTVFLMGNRRAATAMGDHCEVTMSGLLTILANSVDADRLLSLLGSVIASDNRGLRDYLAEVVLRAIETREGAHKVLDFYA